MYFLEHLQATHIVGGNIQMQYIGTGTSNRYRFTVNLFFDQINGSSQAEDPDVVLSIYRRSNNTLVESFTLPKASEQFVQYQNDNCQQAFLSTRLIRYALEVNLTVNRYNQSDGYYAIWDRCCRNNNISNIIAPGDMGSSFYLWFPSISQAGNPFRNSSPAFGIPSGDYLCLNKVFTTNGFAATDADGDQLVYTLVTPFSGYANRNNPSPTPSNTYSFPPPTVSWASGFSAISAITSSLGNPLSINASTGSLSVTPNRTGLFVFSIRCEEFRANVKIGEVRRDFQFLVRECRDNNPPVLSIPLPTDPSQNYQENTVFIIDANTNQNCFKVKIKDTPNENIPSITVRKVSGNYTFRNSPLNVSTVKTDNNGDATVTLCWQACLYSKDVNDLFVFDIIAQDDACPFRGTDTLRVRLQVLPKFNNAPVLTILGASNNVDISNRSIVTTVSDSVEITFKGSDANLDELSVSALINGQDVNLLGFTFQVISSEPGLITSKFRWFPDCRTIKENGVNQEYTIDFVLKEVSNTCDSLTAKETFKLNLIDQPVQIENFTPPNAFTPNGDGVNDYFTLPTVQQSLLVSNCYYRFANIKVYNRWGKKVYESSTQNFQWSGDKLPAGVYYYYLDYTNQIYKGVINILY